MSCRHPVVQVIERPEPICDTGHHSRSFRQTPHRRDQAWRAPRTLIAPRLVADLIEQPLQRPQFLREPGHHRRRRSPLTALSGLPREKKCRKLRPAPAMAAGVSDALWTMDDLYDSVMERENEAQQRERYDRLIAKLGVAIRAEENSPCPLNHSTPPQWTGCIKASSWLMQGDTPKLSKRICGAGTPVRRTIPRSSVSGCRSCLCTRNRWLRNTRHAPRHLKSGKQRFRGSSSERDSQKPDLTRASRSILTYGDFSPSSIAAMSRTTV